MAYILMKKMEKLSAATWISKQHSNNSTICIDIVRVIFSAIIWYFCWNVSMNASKDELCTI